MKKITISIVVSLLSLLNLQADVVYKSGFTNGKMKISLKCASKVIIISNIKENNLAIFEEEFTKQTNVKYLDLPKGKNNIKTETGYYIMKIIVAKNYLKNNS